MDSKITILLTQAIQRFHNGDLKPAEQLLKKVLRKQPGNFDALHILGVIKGIENDKEEAIRLFKKALLIDQGNNFVYFNLAKALSESGRDEESLPHHVKATELAPDHHEAWLNYGRSQANLGLYDQAIASYDRAIQLNPDYAEAWYNKGVALDQLKRYSESIAAYEQALRIRADFVDAWVNKGAALDELKRYNEALADYEQAIRIQPAYAKAWNNKGFTLGELKRYDEAFVAYDKALDIQPDYAEANHNLGLLYLSLLQFDKGWEKYEWRWLTKSFDSPKLATQKPSWRGDRCSGRLLIWAEQGIGDQILYGSLLGNLKEFPQEKIISVESRLTPLFKRAFPEYTFLGKPSEVNAIDYDFQIPMGSLGRYFRHSPQDFAKGVYPYFKADEALAGRLRQQIRQENRLLCGLSWKSSNKNSGNDKSLSLLSLLPILSLENYQFVDLQYGDTGAEKSLLEEKFGISIHKAEEIDNYHDIDGLAALIRACDLVVTASNTTAHLAGALGKETLLLLPYNRGKFWYWHHINGRSLWYPSVSVFEQQVPEDWTEPVVQIESLLKK